MKLFEIYLFVFACFVTKTFALLTPPWYCYANTKYNSDGYQGVPIEGSNDYCSGYIKQDVWVRISTYDCRCDSINVALDINNKFKEDEYKVIRPSQTVSLKAWESGKLRVFASNNCNYDTFSTKFCRFEVNYSNY